MALDIQIVYPQQLVGLSSITRVEGLEPPTLEIVGDDFRFVDSVLINNIASPLTQVLTKKKMRTQIPTGMEGRTIFNVAVVSYQPVHTKKSLVRFECGRSNRKVNGITKLVQYFLKILLQEPGSDIWNPNLGGDALRNIGKTFSKTQAGSVAGDFVVSVDQTMRQITSIQARQPKLPRDERLLSAKVTSARFDVSQTALVVSVLLTSQSGEAAVANILI